MTDKAKQKQTTAAGAVELEESKLGAISAGENDSGGVFKFGPGVIADKPLPFRK